MLVRMKQTIGEANLKVIKIEASHCYMCGLQFQNKGEYKKTMHHAIPQSHKPKRNILIPIHEKCHGKINKFTPQSVPRLKAIDNFVKGMEQFLKKYKKVMERHNSVIEGGDGE